MHENDIKKAFRQYLMTDDVTLSYVHRFLGGMSNYTYHVIINDHDYVIRIANLEGKDFVNYATEKLHLFLLEPYDFTSKTLFYDTTTGIKISEYFPGENLTVTLTPEDYTAVAAELHKLHALPIEGIDYEKKVRIEHYEALVESPFNPDYFVAKNFWLNEFDTHYAAIPYVFTHGDAQRSNILKHGTKYTLLDFEFSGMNDPFYDLASFGNINFDDSLTLLDYYLKRPAQAFEKRRVMFYRLYQVLQWHIVAKIKDDNGQSEKLHIDFKKYSDNYLNFALVLMAKIKALPVR